MLDLSAVAVEPTLANEGVWTEFLGGRFLIARQGPAYKARLVELYNQNIELIKTKGEDGKPTPEASAKSIEVFQRVFAETVILDWENVCDKGVPLAYDPELAYRIVSDPRQLELVTHLEDFCFNRQNYQTKVEQEVAEDVKPSADS